MKDLEMRAVMDYLPGWAQGHHQALRGGVLRTEAEAGNAAAGSGDEGGALTQGMQLALRSWKRPGMGPLLESPVGMDSADREAHFGFWPMRLSDHKPMLLYAIAFVVLC